MATKLIVKTRTNKSDRRHCLLDYYRLQLTTVPKASEGATTDCDKARQ